MPKIPIPEMGTFGIVEFEPSIEVSLQCINRFEERLPERCVEELVQDCSVEPFDKSVCLGRSDLRRSMVDVIESEIEFVWMGFSTAELHTVVREDSLDCESEVAIQQKHIAMKNSNRTLRKLRGVEEAEGERSEGVHHRMEIDPADSLLRTDEECVLTEESTRAVRIRHAVPGSRDLPSQ